jgi:mannose-6-phosphate isomerase-like protein (cupin superfamily)
MVEDGVQRGMMVPAGKDRLGNDARMIWGQFPLATKVSAADTGGAVYVFEHRNMGKGGPPRHVHHHQDEWFYVVQGEFIAEVGEEKFRLHAGDSLFAPRKLPHVWANVGDGPATLLTIASPAGTFETFMYGTTENAMLPSEEEIARQFAANEMTVVGPPLGVY